MQIKSKPAIWILITAVAVWAGVVRAGELLPPDRPIEEVIDYYIDAKLKEASVAPAPQAEDAVLLRRLTLDLAGRIPFAAEVKEYIGSTDPGKRSQAIERLIGSPWFIRHSATEFNTLVKGDGSGPDLRGYLLVAMRENRPWDRMFREFFGEEADPNGPEQYVTKRLNDPDLLTRDVSATFFGINLSCCQCHTHPYVKSLTQDYFFGMKNFFSRCYDFQGALKEKQFGPTKVEYKSRTGKPREAGFKFVTGKVIPVPESNVKDLTKAMQEENKRIEDWKKNFEKTKEYPPEPFFSLRREFVKTAEMPESQELLARSIVNRMWHRFYGYGLVVRVDQMHSENAPSHPELLEWLARDLRTNKWDLKRLTKGLVSSQAYSRSTTWESEMAPAQNLFAVANLRPLTPMQFGMSVMLLGNEDFADAKEAPGELEKKIEKVEASAQANFGSILDQPGEGFQVNVNEPLAMSNDPEKLKLMASIGARLEKLSSRREQVGSAIWAVLGRPPTEREQRTLSHYLMRHSTVAENERASLAEELSAKRLLIAKAYARVTELEAELASLRSTGESQSGASEEQKARIEKLSAELEERKKEASVAAPEGPRDITSRLALEQMVWALVTSPEFRFNH